MKQDQPKRKPGRPKATDSPQTKGLIMRTASFLFMEHGYEKVSLDSVAKACSVTKASVYYYFSNKAALFTESLQLVLKMAYEQTALIVYGPGTLQERLFEVAKKHMRNAHVDFETMMREAASELSAEQVNAIRGSENTLHILLAEVFQKAMDEKEINSSDPMLLSHVFIATMSVRNRREIVNNAETVGQSAQEIVQLIWTGLAPRT
ncbi:TetR/AcrR family transcriptional regulator [Paenibacillus sp. GSMTC-2017]|uniref:TetR/AcrR family transcriptional regulator n=1 Tax=Paenibacillus sp. GSMTC-2017 TaxID=2794350 RepID=UPI0018D85872|nr:TetR/AcrR family transcriptional regulator [Paenibacillus sp. GSMTC-2017]MBH5316463.1 TetR/AcrR family transcriptional regulator [Paenibacillus sp. GSMTC-2017]